MSYVIGDDGLTTNGKLGLPPECLSPATVEANKLYLSIIETVMLWPHDAGERKKALQRTHVEFLRSCRDDWCDKTDHHFFFGYAAEAEPIANVVAGVKRSYLHLHGGAAGLILHETLGAIACGLP